MASEKLDDLVASYLRHLSIERGLAKNTLAAYRRDLTRYLEFLDSRSVTALSSITANLLGEYAIWLSGRGLLAGSIARMIAAVRGFHRFLLLEEVTDQDPAAKLRPPKLPMRLPKALSISEVECLLAAAGPEPQLDDELELGATMSGSGTEQVVTQSPQVGTLNPLAIRNRALLELLYATGARISEIVLLDLDDLTEGGLVRLLGKGSKERVVPVGRYAQRALEVYLVRARPALIANAKRGTPALFLNQRGGRLTRQSAWQIVSDAADLAELSETVSPHSLRHSFATHLLEGGADVRVVQELLGHASVTTTQIYTFITMDSLRQAYLLAHPRARKR